MVNPSGRLAFVVLAVTVLALTIGAQLGSAQSRPVTADWENVKQLAAGANVRVSLAGQATVQGRFQSGTDDSVVVSTKKGRQTVAPQSVVRLSVQREGRRSRNLLIGLGIGAGVGVGAGAVMDSHCAFASCLVSPHLGKLVLGLVGGILGAGVGGVLPAGRWRDIYRE